jgi:TnpA family transposase
VIAANVPEAPLVLDEVLGNATDLPITEHATDTHGATLANFALFDLCGRQLFPPIRDLGKITLTRPGPRAEPTPDTRLLRAWPVTARTCGVADTPSGENLECRGLSVRSRS